MGKYIVKSGQNLYDIALHIYGAIEGIIDIMINNPNLSFCDDLKPGDELLFTDDYVINADVVAYFKMNNLTPANGQRHVYYKKPTYPLFLKIEQEFDSKYVEIGISGYGTIEIDWGDNTDLQTIKLSDKKNMLHHSFDNMIADNRKIRIYGDFRLNEIDLSKSYIISFINYQPYIVERLKTGSNKLSIDFIELFQGIYDINLGGLTTSCLLPLLSSKSLMRLDLSGINTQKEVLDEYLIALVYKYYERRNCHVILTMYPGGEYKEPTRDENGKYMLKSGMEAIWVLTHEKAWNQTGCWKFEINENIYSSEQ